MKSYREQCKELREQLDGYRLELAEEKGRVLVEQALRDNVIAENEYLKAEIGRYQKDAAAKGIRYFNASGYEVKGPIAQPYANPEEA